jgi:AcrR family transcriptional regulator
MQETKQGRPYDSTNRRAQALLTKERILVQARRLFIENGFAATSIADVAAAAGVSAPTVFSAFGSKVNLLKEAAETAMVGDAQPIPMASRPEMGYVRSGRTAEEILDRFADLAAERVGEIYPIYSVIYRNTDGFAEIAALAEEFDAQRLLAAAAMARTLSSRLGNIDSERQARITDCLWTAMSLSQYEALVIKRGWSIAAYRDWLLAAFKIGLELPVTASRQL